MSFYQMHRGWMDSDVWDKQPYGEREAFEWLIGEARWKPGMTNVGGRPISLKRGQCSHSLRFMADKFQWSKKKVECFIEKMKIWGMIKTDNGTGQNIITICNYETYQNAGDTQGDSQGESKGTAGGQQGDKQEEGSNKDKKDNTDKDLCSSPEFEQFWESYPKQRIGSRTKAEAAFRQALKRATVDQILDGVSRYAISDEVAKGFAKGAAAWLNDDRWNSDYERKPAPHGKDSFARGTMEAAARAYHNTGEKL